MCAHWCLSEQVLGLLLPQKVLRVYSRRRKVRLLVVHQRRQNLIDGRSCLLTRVPNGPTMRLHSSSSCDLLACLLPILIFLTTKLPSLLLFVSLVLRLPRSFAKFKGQDLLRGEQSARLQSRGFLLSVCQMKRRRR